MSIWVRSQDKEMLVKINNVFLEKKETMIRNLLTEENLEENNEIYKIVSYLNNMTCFLGTYKSKERAIEVLDEIQEKIRMIQNPKDAYYCVYEMPNE